MSLFKKPGVYRAGVATAPASNLLHARPDEVANAGRPEEQPGAYARSSAINHCENLADHLMIIHGMHDDVVLFEDTIALTEKLIALGKCFDLVVAPGSGHALWERDHYANHLASALVGHFERYLGTAAP
jgi:dipeptidyl-peptidase-4